MSKLAHSTTPDPFKETHTAGKAAAGLWVLQADRFLE